VGIAPRDIITPMADLRWFHTQLWLYGHWLPGDPRGFRADGHKVHSSGDYKHRPPEGEHAGLHRYAKARLTQQPITLAADQRRLVGERLIRWFEIKPPILAAVSVGGVHVHLLCELPDQQRDATVGKAKRYASLESRKRDPELPSKLFAKKGEPKVVRDFEHFEMAYDYVVDKHAAEGAWTWGAGKEKLVELWGG